MTTEIIKTKIEAMIENGQVRAQSVLNRIMADRIEDRIAVVGAKSRLRVLADSQRLAIAHLPPTLTPDGMSGSRLIVTVGAGDPLSLHPHAARQLGDHLGLPAGWVAECVDNASAPWRKDMIADAMTAHIENNPRDRRLLVRSVGSQARAIMTDAYKRLDSLALASAFLDASMTAGARVYDASYTDLRWSISTVNPEPIAVVQSDGTTDYVSAAMNLRSSDFGRGAVELSMTVLRLLCVNGLVGKSQLRAVHLGERIADNVALSDATVNLQTRAVASAVNDLVGGCMAPATIRDMTRKVHEAAAKNIDADDAVHGLVKARKITQVEAAVIERILMNGNTDQLPSGPATIWKVANAVSWVASKHEAERAEELRAVAGELIGV